MKTYTQKEVKELMKESLDMARVELEKELCRLRLCVLAKDLGVKEIKWIKR